MITCLCGLPGEGKSYKMAQMIFQSLQEGRTVFTNFPFFGTYKLEFEDISKKEFPFGSVLYIDEANTWFRNRNWKNFTNESFQLFMHHRHFGMDLILVAQNIGSLDLNIRDIVQDFVYCECFGIPWWNDSGNKYKHALWFHFTYYATVGDIESLNQDAEICRKFEFSKSDIYKKFDSYYKFIEMNREKNELVLWSTIFDIGVQQFDIIPSKKHLLYRTVKFFQHLYSKIVPKSR